MRLFRRIVATLLGECLEIRQGELAVHIVGDEDMTRLNETFLNHAGSTDVITFDYACPAMHGEIFVCADEASSQARRFRTSWQSELVRYAVHGVLHLRGFDDKRAASRRVMKREEGRLLNELARRFALSKLARKTRIAA
jgi:rRNA maturation RNase YbeY